MNDVIVGLIGGTGLGETLAGEVGGATTEVDTPFGPPSGPITMTEIDGQRVAVLARHGEGHRFTPSTVPYQANIYAMKKLGVTHIIASGATGSLQESVEPASLVIPDQVIDKTVRGGRTFFDAPGMVAHVEFADPFCEALRRLLIECAEDMDGMSVHPSATYVCMEGPAFSTRAESLLHRQWGADLIGMTVMPEAKLAREAEICYALVAFPTDYDCWRVHEVPEEGESIIESILANVKTGTRNAINLMRAAAPKIKGYRADCACHDALKQAIWTAREAQSPEAIEKLRPIVGKYVD